MRTAISQMKVKGLFLDYDGTIGPIKVARHESLVPVETATILCQIHRIIPVGIVTTKSLSFIVPRTPFASMWCGIAGLEMKMGDQVVEDPRVDVALTQMLSAIKKAEDLARNNLYIEKKCDLKGRVLAFCIDWRNITDSFNAIKIAREIATECKSMNLWVIEYEQQPFFDVYPFETNKGIALEESKLKLGIKHGIIYMGDSKVDNPAFEVADLGIGVLHEESVIGLECDYYIKFQDVATFLRRLLEENLVFHNDFPEITIEKFRRR